MRSVEIEIGGQITRQSGETRIGGEIAFELREQDVDGDPALVERYGDVLPVVTVAGRAVSEGRLDAAAVRQALLAGPQPAQRADTVDRSCRRS